MKEHGCVECLRGRRAPAAPEALDAAPAPDELWPRRCWGASGGNTRAVSKTYRRPSLPWQRQGAGAMLVIARCQNS
jgi:hypothetical protein